MFTNWTHIVTGISLAALGNAGFAQDTLVDLNGDVDGGAEVSITHLIDEAPGVFFIIPDAKVAGGSPYYPYLDGVVITLQGAIGDIESLSADTSGTSIQSNFRFAEPRQLVLSGFDTVFNYQAVVRSIRYNFATGNIAPGTRTVSFQAHTCEYSPELPATTATITAVPLTLTNPRDFNIGFISGGNVILESGIEGRIHWGRAVIKGNLDFADLAMSFSLASGRSVFTLTVPPTSKLECAGRDSTYDYGITPPLGLERWTRFQCSGLFYRKTGSNRSQIFFSIFGDQISDLFYQVLNGGFGGNAHIVMNGFAVTEFNSPGIYFDASSVAGSGVFVQSWPVIRTIVDYYLYVDMDYDLRKSLAIEAGTYLRPDGSGGFVNHEAVPLWVDSLRNVQAAEVQPETTERLTSITQISMKPLVPTAGVGAGNVSEVAKQILFIDTLEGTTTGTLTEIRVGPGEEFFWKGSIYINGRFIVDDGAILPAIRMKNPSQYASDPTGNVSGHIVPHCFLAGELFCSQYVSTSMDSSVYGRVAAKSGAGPGPLPHIYYSSEMGLPIMVPVTLSSFQLE